MDKVFATAAYHRRRRRHYAEATNELSRFASRAGIPDRRVRVYALTINWQALSGLPALLLPTGWPRMRTWSLPLELGLATSRRAEDGSESWYGL